MRTLLAAVLIALPVQAAEPAKPDVACQNGFCLIRMDTLKALVEGMQKLGEHNAYIETLCGWRK